MENSLWTRQKIKDFTVGDRWIRIVGCSGAVVSVSVEESSWEAVRERMAGIAGTFVGATVESVVCEGDPDDAVYVRMGYRTAAGESLFFMVDKREPGV